MAMKLITAVIQPDKLDEVREELIKAEIYRTTVLRCTGRGRAETTDIYRGAAVAPDLIPKVRLEIACSSEDWADRAIKAILKAAKHNGGAVGDGKIFITPLEQCIRIRTDEEGIEAI